MNYSNEMDKIAKEWAKEQALTEAEAFDWAVRTANIKEFEIDDQYEQAYRKGRADQEKEDERLISENAELRHELKVQAEQINKLREALRRGQEDYYG